MKTPDNNLQPWAESTEQILKYLKTDPETGLGPDEAAQRLKAAGENRLRKIGTQSTWAILLNQFKSFVIVLLSAAAVVSFVFVGRLEGLAIIIAIVINTAIGFISELKAMRSMESLQKISRVTVRVLRKGKIESVPAQRIVPGDIVVVEGGDVVPADLRIIEASNLQADESALTGESVPSGKTADTLDRDTSLADRGNMLYKGTAVTQGSGTCAVVHTGMDTELGSISALVEQAEEEEFTPLEKRLNKLGRRLIWLTLGIAGILAVTGIAAGKTSVLMIETSIALAVAAVPEGLPIVATIALARGMWRMLKRNALINRLSAVETLGTVNTIFTDKTGTLTENRLRVQTIEIYPGTVEAGDKNGGSLFTLNNREADPSDIPELEEILKAGVLCTDAELNEESDKSIGDPLEIAILSLGKKAGYQKDDLVRSMERVRDIPFDPEVKMMAVFYTQGKECYEAVKGAPEQILEHCISEIRGEGSQALNEKRRKEWNELNDHMAGKGLRNLASAKKSVKEKDGKPYTELQFLGLWGLMDPPRQDVSDSIRRCREAGIRVIMLTGDHPSTARYIGRTIGITDDEKAPVMTGDDIKPEKELTGREKDEITGTDIFARMTSKQKLDLIDIHRASGSIVGMTGDGVNDAPALKKADIGIAMGKRGTQVAVESADMVLKDDAFTTIVSAVLQGRTIFSNIRKFIVFLLSGNIGEIMIVACAVMFGFALPILPLQILYLNMIGDVILALALGVGPDDPKQLSHPPRGTDEPVISSGHWRAIAGYGFLIAAAALAAFLSAFHIPGADQQTAVTVSFLTLAFARLWHVFNMRSCSSGVLSNEITRNPFIWGSLAVCTALLLTAVYVPIVAEVLDLARPGIRAWLLIIGMSLSVPAAGQIIKEIAKRS